MGEHLARVSHPGLGEHMYQAYLDDVDTLMRVGLITYSKDYGAARVFNLTPLARRYYEHVKRRIGQPVQQIEADIKIYLDTSILTRYPRAQQKWAEAADLLWASDSEQQLTTIGHLCREAIQEFATALVERYQPPGVEQDKAKDHNRIRAVLDQQAAGPGERERKLLSALLDYWRAVSNLVQRQEHGGQREGDPLVWEDGRRVVFQTAVVMFEIDRSLTRRA